MTLIILNNSNLLLGFVPESIAMLLFGISLISLAVGLRWILARFEEEVFLEEEPVRNFMDQKDQLNAGIEGQLNVNGK